MAKTRLIEKVIVPNSQIVKLPLKEAKEIVEGDKSYKCIAAYSFPISRPDEKNLNERIYPTALWERVIKQKMGEGSYGLMDHPDNEGSTKDRFCVWHNIRFGEDKKGNKVIIADAYLFGRWGQDVEDGIQAGGDVGLSTVGLGEFMEDDITINPNTYELERASDFVLNPSYEVYGGIEDRIEKVEENKEVFEEKQAIKIEDSVKPVEKTDTKESDNMSDIKEKKTHRLEEKAFRFQIKNLMKDADNITDLHERKAEYEDILSYFDDDFAKDLKENIAAKVADADSQIKQLADKGLQLETAEKTNEDLKKESSEKDQEIEKLKKENEEMTKNYKAALEMNDSFKVYVKRVEKRLEEKDEVIKNKEAEINSMVSPTDYKELDVCYEKLEKEFKTLKAENTELKGELKVSERKEKADTSNSKTTSKKEAKKRSTLDITNNDDILEYYNDLVSADPRVEQLRDEILECKTVLEASKKFLTLQSTLEGEDEKVRELERRDIYEGEGFRSQSHKDSVDITDTEHEEYTLPRRKGWL